MRLALVDAAEDDPTFGAELDTAVAELRAVAEPNGHGSIRQKITTMSHSNAIGAISGGDVHIDQSQVANKEACFCGLHANAKCPRCGKEVCANHNFVADVEALRYREITTSGGSEYRTHPAYPALFASGGPGCVRCRFTDADAEVEKAGDFVRHWLDNPRQLTERDFHYLSQFPTMLLRDAYQPMLASIFQLYRPDADLVVVTISATMPEQTRKQRKDYVWPEWQIRVTVESRHRAITVPDTNMLVTETGLVYMTTARPALNAEGATALAVSSGVVPEVRNVPARKRWTPKTGPEFFQEDWQPTAGVVVRQVGLADLPNHDITALFDNLRAARAR